MKAIQCVGALAALLFCAAAVAQDQYLCLPDQATGFSFDKKDGWHRTGVKVGEKKYLLRRSNADDFPAGSKWLVFELGQKVPYAYCDSAFDNTGQLTCRDLGLIEWRMDKNTMRFLLAYLAGYTNGVDNNDDTPSMIIGKCAPL